MSQLVQSSSEKRSAEQSRPATPVQALPRLATPLQATLRHATPLHTMPGQARPSQIRPPMMQGLQVVRPAAKLILVIDISTINSCNYFVIYAPHLTTSVLTCCWKYLTIILRGRAEYEMINNQ